MTSRSDCPYCHGTGLVVISKDPDRDADCLCTDPIVCAPEFRCAECRDGKHGNCTGWALDDGDRLVDCECGCQGEGT